MIKTKAFKAGYQASQTVLVSYSFGKILVAGDFTGYNDINRNSISGLNSDGSLDTSFDPGSGANGGLNSITVQSNGKVLIGGYFTSYNGIARNYIARLNSDGSLDTSFDPGSGVSGNNGWASIQSITLQSDGKILIGGAFSFYDGTARNNIARLNSDGSLDTSFDPGSGANSIVESIVLQSNGKILIGGLFNSYNGTPRHSIARLNSNGSLDVSFTPADDPYPDISSIILQSDGKILIGGQFLSYNGVERHRIARLNSDGSLDSSFNPGTAADGGVYSMALQNDGKILIAGDFMSYNGINRHYIARLNCDGTLDTSLDPGDGANSDIYSIALQSNGKILIAGAFTVYNGITHNYLARINSDGSLDTSFDPGDGTNGTISSVIIKNNGKILVGGNFVSSNGIARNHIAKLNSDGTLDTSFDPGDRPNSDIYSMALQSDGKILIGEYISSSGSMRYNIARLNTNGTLDPSFDPGDGPDYAIYSIAIQSDGKILIAGSFTNYDGTNQNHIARLSSDGSLDLSFNSGSGSNDSIESIILQSDGKILIIGSFTSYNDITRNNIARLNSDGSLDTSFDPVDGPNSSIYSMALQNNGKILIGGDFTNYNGTACNYIARLNSNGSLDTSFDSGDGANYDLESIAVQSDGKILIGGYFSTYNNIPRNSMARLNTDGTLDTSFDPGSGVDSDIYSIVPQSDGKILIGGFFTSYNGTAKHSIAKLNSDGSLDNGYTGGVNNGVYTILVY